MVRVSSSSSCSLDCPPFLSCTYLLTDHPTYWHSIPGDLPNSYPVVFPYIFLITGTYLPLPYSLSLDPYPPPNQLNYRATIVKQSVSIFLLHITSHHIITSQLFNPVLHTNNPSIPATQHNETQRVCILSTVLRT